MKTIGKSKFEYYIMHGYMRKKVDQESFFQRETYPKRYFVLNFHTAVFYIRHRPEPDSKTHTLAFREVTAVRRFTRAEEHEFRRTAYEKYYYGFEVTTTKRLYYLFCSTDEERTMWITGLEYVIVSTRRVQQLLDENKEKEQQLLKAKKIRVKSVEKTSAVKLTEDKAPDMKQVKEQAVPAV